VMVRGGIYGGVILWFNLFCIYLLIYDIHRLL